MDTWHQRVSLSKPPLPTTPPPGPDLSRTPAKRANRPGQRQTRTTVYITAAFHSPPAHARMQPRKYFLTDAWDNTTTLPVVLVYGTTRARFTRRTSTTTFTSASRTLQSLSCEIFHRAGNKINEMGMAHRSTAHKHDYNTPISNKNTELLLTAVSEQKRLSVNLLYIQPKCIPGAQPLTCTSHTHTHTHKQM